MQKNPTHQKSKSLDKLFASAVIHHKNGNLNQAEKTYQKILSKNPGHTDALHMFGVLKHQLLQINAAKTYILEAIRLNPTKAAY